MITITPKMKTIWHKNKLTGEEYSTTKILKGFEVNGGFYPETYHTSLRGAEKEKAYRISINTKFPFNCPRSQKEIERGIKYT
jgi:hypothetical protein